MYEYKQKDKDIVSLSINFRELVPSSDEITEDELRLVTTDARKNMPKEELNKLKNRFKKINYTILDMEQNRKGFGVTEDAMQFFVKHFEDTKEDQGLHNLFKDHDYQHIDSLMGRIVDTYYDEKNKRVRRTALVDMRHPSAERLDMFQNLSTTLLHGKPVCSTCGDVFQTCRHFDAFPRSTVAVGIEDSLVSIPAHRNAKRDSLGIFKTSLSGIAIADEFFSYEEEITDIDKLNAESIIIDKDIIAPSAIEEDVKGKQGAKIVDKDKLAAEGLKLEKEEKQTEELGKIKKDLEFIKEVIEKDI
ncbi:hypothetical protein LCGC14_0617800 [marine sediment metagenome]|uniref:Uncharacterized protein n=1 Tax=marine sediment metagenome TaxID=412755 RepID=A0A0F9UEB5_9ZZZZ